MASIRKKKQAAKRNTPRRSLMEHVRSLPPELEQKLDEPISDTVQTAQGESETSAVSSASVKPIPVNVSVKVEQEQVNQEEKKQQDELKVDKNLLKAVEKLTKSFDFANKKAEEEKKKGLRGYINNKIQNVKNAFTLEGAAGMLGVRKDDGSLKGAILGSIMERREKKQEKEKFIANFSEFTDKGRSLQGDKRKLVAEGEKRYNAFKKIKEEREFIERKAAQAKAFGGELSEKDEKRLKLLTLSEGLVKGNRKSVATLNDMSNPEIAATNEPKPGKPSASKPKRDSYSGAALMTDLLKINEQQLEQLEEILKALKPSEEELLESKRQESLAPIMERKEQTKDANSNGSLLDIVKSVIPSMPKMSTIMNIGKSIVRGGAKALTTVGKFAARGVGKAASLVGSGISKAASAGSKVLPSIVSGAQKGMGVVSKIAGEVPGVAKAAGGLAKGVLGKLGPIAMLGMAAYDGISGYGKAGENLGIEGREATTGEKLASAGGSILSGLSFGLLDEKSMSKGIANLVGAGPEKLPDAQRIQQTQELAAKNLESSLSSASQAAPVPNVTNIVNNNSVSNKSNKKPRIPVRNEEPTYMKRMDRHFRFA
jgi:hypothetical protein